MANPLTKLIHPWYPSTALGLEQGSASMVDVEHRGNVGSLRRAATMKLPPELIRPSFFEQNISDSAELASALSELASSAGLSRQKRWSVSLPEATARTLIVTLEAHAGSNSELEEILEMENGPELWSPARRTFNFPRTVAERWSGPRSLYGRGNTPRFVG